MGSRRVLFLAMLSGWALGCAADASETFLDELDSPPVVDSVVPLQSRGAASSTERVMLTRLSRNAPTVVFLNRSGRTYSPGTDDSASGTSSVLRYYRRGAVRFPPARYDGGEWATFITTIRRYFSPFDVLITDARPDQGPYLELAVGDAWASVLGLSNNLGGVAPQGPCAVVREGVGYVFTRIFDLPGYGAIGGAAEAAAHEIGHMLSLSHASLATDLMSYAPHSPRKDFQDQHSACGTTPHAEPCACGARSQNSHQQLLAMLGERSADTPPSGATSADRTAPTVVLVTPADGTRFRAQSTVEITVEASDDTAVSTLGLYWQFLGRVLACDDSVPGVSCTRAGSRFTWRIYVGSGERRFYALAGDAASNHAQTPSRTVYFDDPNAPESPADAPPTVAPRSPVGGTVFMRGTQVILQAEVHDDVGLSDVRAVWSYEGGTLEFPMAQTAVPGLWQGLTTVGRGAPAGSRGVTFVATDSTGQRTSTGRVEVSVR